LADISKYLNTLQRITKILFKDPTAFKVINRVRQERLSYLNLPALLDLYDGVNKVDDSGFPGILVEAGCALGGSALVMAAAKMKDRHFHIYDTFEGIPPPSDEDGEDVLQRYTKIMEGGAEGKGGLDYYGYRGDLLGEVRNRFTSFGFPLDENHIQLVKGLFQDTMKLTQPVVFAHIDSDWYESVLVSLKRIEPQLVPGGIIIIDDYDRWSGCKKAVDEYFRDKDKAYRFVHKARMHIIRKSPDYL
jgi:asparagine synthase (glutamine-hydrolysing)